ncbi:hypothetical protein EMCG_08846 [[Emmonsia] crescens]|uniref:Uncharacterized protein n=1 Tax=[Emmonsia] crescens TaxID=73230 RepID=A0A0G2I508_9EURO|nr:hypothetical protein EMCG_08846 [Emmonsia crescens UAMH 3008]
MTGCPRQVDMAPQAGAIEQHQPATASDIQNLIAAIGKLEKRDRAQLPSNRSTCNTTDEPPLSSPTRVPWRLTKLLDSLAGLLVSNANHEVIATALRVDTRTHKITIMISSNTTVPPATCEHAIWIWRALREISFRYHQLYASSSKESSPTHEIKDQELLNMLSNFRNKFSLFEKLDLTEFDEGHPLRQLSTAIFTLEKYFTRNKCAVYGKPDENMTEAWDLMQDLFRICQESVRYIFKNDGLTPDERLRLSGFPHWESYFRKVALAMDEVDRIVRVSMSPQCRHLFHYEFNLHPVPATMSKAHTIPQNAKDWEDVLERALSRRNKSQQDSNLALAPELKLLKMSTITKDTAYMCREQIGKDLVIHCEVKLLLLIARLESENPSLAKAYSYLGGSKLLCHDYHVFIEAYNRIHRTRFMTRGAHGKSYRPWQFPKNFPKHKATTAQMYALLANTWGDHYNGYEIKMKELSQDSTAGSDFEGPANFEVYNFSRRALNSLVRDANDSRFGPDIEEITLNLRRWNHQSLHTKLWSLTKPLEELRDIHHPILRRRREIDIGDSEEVHAQIDREVGRFETHMDERISLVKEGDDISLLTEALKRLPNLNSICLKEGGRRHCWRGGSHEGAECGDVSTLRRSWQLLSQDSGGIESIQLLERHHIFRQLLSSLSLTGPIPYLTSLDICGSHFEYVNEPSSVPTFLAQQQLRSLSLTMIASYHDVRDDQNRFGPGIEISVLQRERIAYLGTSVSLPHLEHLGISGFLLDFRDEKIYSQLFAVLASHSQTLRSIDLSNIKVGAIAFSRGPFCHTSDVLKHLARCERLERVSLKRFTERSDGDSVTFEPESKAPRTGNDAWVYTGPPEQVRAKLRSLAGDYRVEGGG